MWTRNLVVRNVAPLLGGLMISGMSGYLLAAANQEVVKITARQFEFSPASITVKKGTPVILELSTLDMPHGFDVPDLGVHARIVPGQAVRLNLTAAKAGHYAFQCDSFCGAGHDDMKGEIVVTD
jgi:cytochrome c oxidase subunit II